MATWSSRGLRGSTLEDMINRTNEKYCDSGLALIQKIPTPITPIKMDKEHRQIHRQGSAQSCQKEKYKFRHPVSFEMLGGELVIDTEKHRKDRKKGRKYAHDLYSCSQKPASPLLFPALSGKRYGITEKRRCQARLPKRDFRTLFNFSEFIAYFLCN